VKLYPDEPLDAALRLLALRPRIEVVSRLKPDQILGTLTLDDVQRAYGIKSGPAGRDATHTAAAEE
jgi:hypothetical protein